MIARLIAWSARNLVLILIGTVFAVAGGTYAVKNLPLDAIQDLSDVQVIVYTTYPGQAPQVVEDQVTYPSTKNSASRYSERLMRLPNVFARLAEQRFARSAKFRACSASWIMTLIM